MDAASVATTGGASECLTAASVGDDASAATSGSRAGRRLSQTEAAKVRRLSRAIDHTMGNLLQKKVHQVICLARPLGTADNGAASMLRTLGTRVPICQF